jgi:hypothetical protein
MWKKQGGLKKYQGKDCPTKIDQFSCLAALSSFAR